MAGTACSISCASHGSITVMCGMARKMRHVFRRLMAWAVSRGEARQRADDLHVAVFFGDRLVNEVVGAARRKNRIGCRKGHESLAAIPRPRRTRAARPYPSDNSGREIPSRRCGDRCICRDRRSCRSLQDGSAPVRPKRARRARLRPLSLARDRRDHRGGRQAGLDRKQLGDVRSSCYSPCIEFA